MIGDLVEITIVDIRGDKVRLGINAPPQVAVHRKEVYEAIKAENQIAASTNGSEFAALSKAVRPGRKAALTTAGRIAGDSNSKTNGQTPDTRPKTRNAAT